jgi:hypothetical protein
MLSLSHSTSPGPFPFFSPYFLRLSAMFAVYLKFWCALLKKKSTLEIGFQRSPSLYLIMSSLAFLA